MSDSNDPTGMPRPFYRVESLMFEMTSQQRRLFVCDCAERIVSFYEAAYPDDHRLRHIIEVGRRYALNNATEQELNAAAGDASDANDNALFNYPTNDPLYWPAIWAATAAYLTTQIDDLKVNPVNASQQVIKVIESVDGSRDREEEWLYERTIWYLQQQRNPDD
jgi:hypothetical protein